jgi:hypothetical protein
MKEWFDELLDRLTMARARRYEGRLRRSLEVQALTHTGGVEVSELGRAVYEWLLADAAACRAIRRRSEWTWAWVCAALCIAVGVFAYRAGVDSVPEIETRDCYIVEQEVDTAQVQCIRSKP